MTEPPPKPPIAEFAVDPNSPSKRPEQLVSLLVRVLGQEFPEAFARLEVVHADGTEVVTVAQRDDVGEEVVKEVAHRARAVYGEFVTSPWY